MFLQQAGKTPSLLNGKFEHTSTLPSLHTLMSVE
jgi:hypothetical protein